MTCRVQAQPAGAAPVGAQLERLELIELSFMGVDRPSAKPPSTRSATAKIRFRESEQFGHHTAPTRLFDCVCHAMMNAVRKLGLFADGREPVLTIFEVKSCHPGSETEGAFLVTLEYKGQSRTTRLQDVDLVTGSRRAVLDTLNALLFGAEGQLPANPSVTSSGENAEFIGAGCE